MMELSVFSLPQQQLRLFQLPKMMMMMMCMIVGTIVVASSSSSSSATSSASACWITVPTPTRTMTSRCNTRTTRTATSTPPFLSRATRPWSSSASSSSSLFFLRDAKTTTKTTSTSSTKTSTLLLLHMMMSDDWSSFTALDDNDSDNDYLNNNNNNDEDELLYGKQIDRTQYAVENDSDEIKAAVGSTLAAPTIEYPAEPISVPAGSQLDLSEETVLGVLAACRQELGTLFGYTAENRGVGITGGVDYVDLDGPIVILKLKGRFWHERTTVLERVANYLQQRIPEIVDVTVQDPWQLTDEANEVW